MFQLKKIFRSLFVKFIFSRSLFLYILFFTIHTKAQNHVYLDTTRTQEERIHDLVGKLTLEEKVSQLLNDAPAIPRLDIPQYNWWNESLHGVARSGVATVFPQAIGLGATFDESLILQISTAISDEARAMYNAAVKKGYHQKYGGLTFWTPNVNIFRDPRWGRGQETYGEDPYLTSVLGVAYVKGLQGNNPDYLKAAACAKHFAVHSGPEKDRHEFNAVTDPIDLRETYLPAFKALVGAGVESVMCAYNRTNDEPCCASKTLLTDILKNEWGFNGHIVTDCGALIDFYEGHKVVDTDVEAAALALNHDVNLNCGLVYNKLIDAVEQGLVQEDKIDQALSGLLRTRFKLGLFDPAGSNPYDKIPVEVINSEEHRSLAREAAVKSIVMLKNNGVLPLSNGLSSYLIVGPTAASVEALLGNYYGVNPDMFTILEGIAGAIEPGSQLQYRPGILLDRDNVNPIDYSIGPAKTSNAIFAVLGLTGVIEGEEGAAIASADFGDRLDYNLPKNQIDYLRKLKNGHDNPVIAIITGGSPMNLSEVHEIADAVLLVWYPGEEGGNAVADIIFGKESPSGRLPITFPKSLDQLPPYKDYSMQGRTYRYMSETPMYPFGYGLSYARFEYSNIRLSESKIRKGHKLNAEISLKNTGSIDAEEVVQLYVTKRNKSVQEPLFSLKGFKRVRLAAGDSVNVQFQITPEMLTFFNEDGDPELEKGEYSIFIGGSLPINRSSELGMPEIQETVLTVK